MPKRGGPRTGAGRPRKPTKLHVIHGTFVKRRHERLLEGQPGSTDDGRLPQAPADLSPAVRAAWDDLASSISDSFRIFTREDVQAFRTFAGVWATYLECERHIFTQGMTVETDKGEAMAPQMRTFLDVTGKLLSYFSRFGMTPADRSRVQLVGKAKADAAKDPDDEFASKRT